ncbi:hypothetical protein [Pseudomonas syringae]|uniref:hypothetical protein n=1 Tax=Pseudomonas syringae TaxID=317 RepID=UPI000A22E9A0|nr:hypothetical protein [Pseudomonas syringae]OSR67131.1 hypothetical protein BV327_04822 [Pseudomonas syringae pv. actinidiae]
MLRLIERAANHAATILAIQNEAVGHDVLREVIAGLLGYEDFASVTQSKPNVFPTPSGRTARLDRAARDLEKQKVARASISDVNVPAIVTACQRALMEKYDGSCVVMAGALFYKRFRYPFTSGNELPAAHQDASSLSNSSSPFVVGRTRRFAEKAKQSAPAYEPLVSAPPGKPRRFGADVIVLTIRLDNVLIWLPSGSYSHAYCGFAVHVDSNAILSCAVSSTDDWSQLAAETLANALGAPPASVESPQGSVNPFCPARLIQIAIDEVNLAEPLLGALQANSFRVLKPRIKDRVRLDRLVVWIHEAVGSDHVARSKRCELQQSTAISLFTKEHLAQLIRCEISARNLTLQDGAASYPLELLRECMLAEAAPPRPYEWRTELYSALMSQF